MRSPPVKRRDLVRVNLLQYVPPDLHRRRHLLILDSERFVGEVELADLLDHRQLTVDPLDRGAETGAGSAEESRAGKERVRRCKSRRGAGHSKKKNKQTTTLQP